MADPFAIHLLPATGEWVYDTRPHRARRLTEAAATPQNRYAHLPDGRTDVALALDQLQATYPGCRTVSLVCAWFGDSTDVSRCRVYPSTTFIGGDCQSWTGSGWEDIAWQCSSLTHRSTGLIPITQIGDSFVYGGTPSDPSIVRCIRELKARGLRVMFYPFLLMDCAGYPWRGRISAVAGDRTAATTLAISTFLGAAAPADFVLDTENLTVAYSGNSTDYTYRRMILHYANLCVVAGGVDLFLIGSELRGLEALRGPDWTPQGRPEAGGHTVWDYPFVEGLLALARDVRLVFDAAGLRRDRETRKNLIAYSADWSNWMGVQHADAGGQWPHLDTLYAADAVDLVSFDNYMPLSDWTTGDGGLDARHWRDPKPLNWPPDAESMNGLGQAGPPVLASKSYLKANIEGGDKYAWFYYDSENVGAGLDPNGSGLYVSRPRGDRLAQVRRPYQPGQELLANKMVRWWWSNEHRAVYDDGDGQGAVPRGGASAWRPFLKSITFGEYGFPTCDRCTNQPNVFFDPKSSESFTPFWSSWESMEGGARRPKRDDVLASLAHDAIVEYWTSDGNNVLSPSDLPMIDVTFMAAWNWDARPFPVFPQSDVWGDAGNWRSGTWLTGKGPALPPKQSGPGIVEKAGLVLPELSSQGWTTRCWVHFATGVEQSASGKESRAARAARAAWRVDLSFEEGGDIARSLPLLADLYARLRGRAGSLFLPAPLGDMDDGPADYGLASAATRLEDDEGLASVAPATGDYGQASILGTMAYVRFAEDDLDVEVFMRAVERLRRVSFVSVRL